MRLDISTLSAEEVEQLTLVPRTTAVLADFAEGDAVSVKGAKGLAVVVGVMTEDFEFPVGKTDDGDPKLETIEASKEDPIYLVATEQAGLVAVSGDQLSAGSLDVSKETAKKDAQKLAQRAESAAIYDYMDDPCGDVAALRAAQKALIVDHNAEALAAHDTDGCTVEELLNIPGVDDPEVGFSSLPNGWTRKSVLQAWASLGGRWTTCVAMMTGDIRSPKRFCAALKDEVLQTELWRNRF